MKTHELNVKTGFSEVITGVQYDYVLQKVSPENTIIITDDNVEKYHKISSESGIFADFPNIILEHGENAKSLTTIDSIYKRLILLEADRSTFLLGFGGGVVCDITGFVASTFMRGLRFGFIPSTLLAQVDAAIGGKNGVNYNSYKNIIGCIRQPEFVICDTELLKTIPQIEIRSGIAEIVKTALVGSPELFSFLEKNYYCVQALAHDALDFVINECIKFKIDIVSKDDTEKDLRRILNFGHTLGHALEALKGISHGEAVSIGMATAINISVKKDYLAEETATRIRLLLERFNLPLSIEFEKSALLRALMQDKKRRQNVLNYVLLRDIGEPTIEKIPLEQFMDLL